MKPLQLLCALALLAGLDNGQAAERPRLKTEFQDTQPKFIQGKDGRFSGLCVELLDSIARAANVEFTHPGHFIPQRRSQANLARGRIDVSCGIKKTTEREDSLKFSEPLYSVAYMIIGRRDEALRFNSIAELAARASEVLVLSIQGSGSTQELRPRLPSLDDSARDVETNLRKLLNGRGRVLVHYDLALRYEIEQNPLGDQVMIVGQNIEPYTHHLAFGRHVDAALIARIDAAIRMLKSKGEWQAILARYYATPP